jgi:hypothetical protein
MNKSVNERQATHFSEAKPSVHKTAAVRAVPVSSTEVRSGASLSLTQLFRLDARAAALTVLVDLLVFGTDAISFGALLPIGIGVAAVLAFIVYKIQRNWYGDDHNSALIKALVIALLTALPVPITSVLAIPAGIAGIMSRIRRK